MHSKIIDVIQHPRAIHKDMITTLLSLPVKPLSHGSAFSGKPGTQLHCSNHFILKQQKDLNFSSRNLAIAWATKKYTNEKELHLYPPEKTWFSLETETGWTVANITPHLQMIHTLMKEDCITSKKLGYLTGITDLYLAYGAGAPAKVVTH